MFTLSRLASWLTVTLLFFGVEIPGLSPEDTPVIPKPTEVVEEVATATPEVTEATEAVAEPTAVPEAEQVTAEPTPEETAVPTDVPTQPAAQPFVGQDDVLNDVQTLVTGIFSSVMNDTDYALPADTGLIVEDNPQTHLVKRWADYLRAYDKKFPETHLKAFNRPGATPTFVSAALEGENQLVKASCKTSILRENQETLEQELIFDIVYTQDPSGVRKIVSLKISGDEALDNFQTLTADAADIVSIDRILDEQIASIG